MRLWVQPRRIDLSWTMSPSLSYSLYVTDYETPHLSHWEDRLKALYATFLVTLICAISPAKASAQPGQVDQSALSGLLARHVSAGGWVDYAGLRQDRTALQSYLDTLRNVDVAKLPSDAERLAFWIDAYNAFTLNDVLEYVDGKTDSVKKVNGF